jgi:hypothetical protein
LGNFNAIAVRSLELYAELRAHELHRQLVTARTRKRHRALRGRTQVLQQLIDEHGHRGRVISILQEGVEVAQRIELLRLARDGAAVSDNHVRKVISAQHCEQLGRSVRYLLLVAQHLLAKIVDLRHVLAGQTSSKHHQLLQPAT